MRGLNGKKVLITGAAGGIGWATAKRFIEEGSHVLLCDLRPLDSTTLTADFGAEPAEKNPSARVAYVSANVASAEGAAKLEAICKTRGLDVLINNAGITRDASLGKMTMDDWDAVIAVNLSAVFRLSQMAGALMKVQKSGCILNAASVVAHTGNFGQANYVASKAGVIGLTKTLARELGRSNIRVNAVAPGFTVTEMVKTVPQEALAATMEKTPLRRLGQPEEIAAAYAFLASDDAAFITGTTLNVDGGLVV